MLYHSRTVFNFSKFYSGLKLTLDIYLAILALLTNQKVCTMSFIILFIEIMSVITLETDFTKTKKLRIGEK